MGRYSYDDMPPEGKKDKEGGGKTTIAIALIGVIVTLLALVLYLLFAPSGAESADVNKAVAVTAEAAEPEIIEAAVVESREPAAAPVQETRPRIEVASDRYQPVYFNDYYVRPGDTLPVISAIFNLNINTIVSVNKLRDTNLQAGTVLRLPAVDGTLYTVQEGDTLQRIAELYNPALTAPDLAALNGKPYTAIRAGEELFIPAPNAIVDAGGSPFSSPLPGGRVTHRCGEILDGRSLDGVVVSSAAGSAVLAADDGVVLDFPSSPVGRAVSLLHDNGYTSFYYGLESVSTAIGEQVRKGSPIGTIGSSLSMPDGPSVLFIIEQNSVPLDPVNLTDF